MKKLVQAAIKLILGVSLGLGLLETTLNINPGLLFRGMSLPGPVDPPVTSRSYTVRYSDADAFYWRPDLVRPVTPEKDQVEDHVEFITDEFGFRNQAPLPDTVDVVVLGRSISLAAHLSKPWPKILANLADLKVMNLAQSGGGLVQKEHFLVRYGLPRHPRWVILEIAPSLDIIGGVSHSPAMVQGMVYPLIQSLWRQSNNITAAPSNGTQIYPLHLEIPGQFIELTCCLHYMEFFSLDRESLEQSRDWKNFKDAVIDLNNKLKDRSICLALLYAPTKPDFYFPLATKPEALELTLGDAAPYALNENNELVIDTGEKLDIETVHKNANAGRELVSHFAQQNNIVLFDPSEAMVQAELDGISPFMVYDSHWNSKGHEIVAQEVAKILSASTCP